MELTTSTLIGSVAEIIRNSRERVFRMANSALLETYWEIGKLIIEDEQSGNAKAQYGKATLKKLAEALTLEFGKGFDERNLNNMRAFYAAFPIWNALRTELSWTHYRILSRLDSGAKRDYYLQESITSNWNSRELQRQINALAFERVVKHLPESSGTPTIENLIKDPYIFEFLGFSGEEKNSEKSIETAIINHLQRFLLELGKGFAFVARQQHIVTDTSDFYIDLVFYNYILKCFIIIDLKKGAMTHQDIGQLDMYVRMYDDMKRVEGDNPTIGLLLCSEKDEAIVKYSVLNDQNNLFANKYLLYLPKEEQLKKLIEEDRLRFELENEKK
jgi:predicted nuclease of restriction endonuclease-like (RecB) superfamily